MAISDLNIDKNAKVAVKHVSVAMPTIVVSKTRRPFKRLRPGFRWKFLRLRTEAFDETGAVSVMATKVPTDHSGVLQTAGLAIDATPEDFQTGLFTAMLAGVAFEKAAATGQSFTAAHVITATKWGIILIQCTAAGVVSTKVPAATPTTAMAYESEALALAALPSPDASNISLGYIIINAGVADWDANTDDMTDGSDCVTADFVSTAVSAEVVDLLTAGAAFADGTVTDGATDTDPPGVTVGTAEDDILLSYTSDGTGALVAGSVDVFYRPYPMARG